MFCIEKYLDIIVQYPYGVQKLREMILALAMQGRLVPQNPSDESASELLKQLENEKKQLIKAGKIKKTKVSTVTHIEEFPYELPSSWEWVRLSSVGNIFNGNSINATEKERRYKGCSGYPYIATKDVGYGTDSLDYDNGVCIPVDESKFKIAHSGSVLLCAEGGSAGKKSGLVTQDICFGNKLFALEPFEKIDSKFILFLYNSNDFRCRFNACMTGIIGGVSIAKFAEILIPLPPAAEQKRIVEKIEKLMVVCDRLDEMIREKKKTLKKTQQTLIKNLFSGIDFEENLLKLLANIKKFNGSKEDIDEIRKIILQLAVMGKLVPQDPSDESASELLKNIKFEKKELLKTGKIKKIQYIYPIVQEESPYELPKSWELVQLNDISTKITDGEHKTPLRESSGYFLLSARNITNDGIKLDDVDYVGYEEFQRIRKRCDPEKGDILISCSGSIGRIAICDSDQYVMVRSAAMVKLASNVNNIFIAYMLQSDFLQYQISIKSKTTAQSNLFLGKIAELVLPLPPCNEQKRIVAKISTLMRLCDHLEQLIATHEAGCKIVSDKAVKEIAHQEYLLKN